MYVFYFVFILLSTIGPGIGTHEEGTVHRTQHHTRFVKNYVDILLSKTTLYPYTVCDNGIV